MNATEIKKSIWQPIDTAPKDGSYVIVWPPTWIGVISMARWEEHERAVTRRKYWCRSDNLGIAFINRDKPPTHWAKIPDGLLIAPEE